MPSLSPGHASDQHHQADKGDSHSKRNERTLDQDVHPIALRRFLYVEKGRRLALVKPPKRFSAGRMALVWDLGPIATQLRLLHHCGMGGIVEVERGGMIYRAEYTA